MAIEATGPSATITGAPRGGGTAAPTSAPQPLTSAALLGALAAGATLEARLVAVLADGSAKLATRVGAFVAKTDGGAQLPPVGTQLELRVDARAAADGQPLLLARSGAAPDAAGTRADAQIRPPATVVGEAVASALARQEGLGAGLKAVETLLASGTRLPPEVAAAAEKLLRLRLPLDPAPSAKALAAAMRSSGIFFEADLARAAPPAAADLKAALIGLKTALSSLGAAPGGAGEAGRAPAPTPGAAGAPSAASVPAAAPPPAAAQSAPAPGVAPQGPATSPTTATPAAPVVAPPAAATTVTAPAPAVPTRFGLLSLQEIAEVPPAPRADPASPGAHAAPPLRGRWPEPETLAPADRAAGPSGAAEAVGRAREGTEAALARLVLDQVASLADDATPERARLAGPAERVGPQWSFEVPVLIDGRSGALRFQVERDGGERRDGSPERRQQSWRLRLAFAIEPLGAIRAQVGLVGGRVAVGIWAERPATVAALSAHAGELRDALVAADFEVDEIHLAEGLPPDALRRAGGRAMLDATA